MRNVGLIGVKRAGKTTLAEAMACCGYKRLSIAEPVKVVCHQMVCAGLEAIGLPPVTREAFDRDKAAYRPLLQWFGTDLVREHLGYGNLWMNELVRRAIDHSGPVVVDDVRFPQEVERLRGHGFVIVKVERPALPDDGDRHPSEAFARSFTDADLTITNGDAGVDAWHERGMLLAERLTELID